MPLCDAQFRLMVRSDRAPTPTGTDTPFPLARTHATGGYRTHDPDNSVTTRSLSCVVARTTAAMLVISRAWERYSHNGPVASSH
jgi:hypothetical protein